MASTKGKTGLTAKEQAFCSAYISTGGNGTKSAIMAGYSERTAHVTSSQLLNKTKIISRIDELKEKVDKKNIASAQEVMEYFTKVMNGEIADQFGLEASLSDRTKAAIELARRTVDLENRVNGTPDAKVEISLNWSRDE